MSPHRRANDQTQPLTQSLYVKDLISFPYRLCHPPPPTDARVRSYGVKPLFRIHLDDVLNRRHLPPLGLKDFEEWLLYVEHCPENLYFILWLKDYTLRYKQWALQLSPHTPTSANFPTQTSTHLLMFYARAKQTFFTPNSDYELNVPSSILSPFHNGTSNKFGTTPPDPATFAPVACEVQRMLDESLQRFVVAAYTNVGTVRGWCGLLGGMSIALMGSVPPIVYNIVMGKSRWLRLTAFPGLWIGLVILIASLNGVCMMIYIFGDLRQLRKFELLRPPISRPRPITPVASPSNIPTAITRQPLLPPDQPPRSMSLIPSPPRAVIHNHHREPRTRTISTSTCASSASTSSSSSLPPSASASQHPGEIDISPAYFDEVPVDIASMVNHSMADSDFPFPPNIVMVEPVTHAPVPFIPTAPFIHPYHPPRGDNDNGHPPRVASPSDLPNQAFDFDALPCLNTQEKEIPPPVIIQPDKSSHAIRLTPKSLLARAQYRCNLNIWKLNVAGCQEMNNKASLSSSSSSPSPISATTATATTEPKVFSSKRRRHRAGTADIQAQLKLVQGVPAFGIPVTRVLNPLVIRAQWEIVMRSVLFAFKASLIVLGCLLAVPVKKR